MSLRTSLATRARIVLAAGALAVTGLALAGPQPAVSAPAADATLTVPATVGSSQITWSGTAPLNNGESGLVWGQTGTTDPTGACTPSNTTLNSQYHVDVEFPAQPDPSLSSLVRFSVDWSDDAGGNATTDLALYLYDPSGHVVAISDGSQNEEGVNLRDPVSGVYTVLVCAFQNATTGTPYTAKAVAYTRVPGTVVTKNKLPDPTYRQYSAPAGSADDAGEPSIGSNWKSGATLFTSNVHEYKVGFDDAAGTSTWTRVNTAKTDPSNKISFDPIGWTDHTTGRTIISQLYLACSASAYTDDDFATVNPGEGCGSGINGFDHQTFGGGPYPAGFTSIVPPSYPHAVYYCSQGQALTLGSATCARSDDGGVTFGSPVNTWRLECSGIHGHVQVGPDGTVYLPNAKCGDRQGMAVSTDAGKTWTVRTVPDSIAGDSDPFVAIGANNTVYFAYSDGSGEARVAISHDHGATWTKSYNVGGPFSIRNSEFASAVAGDDGRMTVAFLGTPTAGSQQSPTFGLDSTGTTYTGAEWHAYLATTYDGGQTWSVVDGTPTDPVQRGCIWNAGGSNECRNLLDFTAITIDKTGRVMFGIADGCTGACVTSTAKADNPFASHGAVIRQTGGLTLFSAYDPKKK